MDVFGEDLTIEQFFQDYWRQKPLVVRGGAERFLGRVWTATDFDRAYVAVREDEETEASIQERADDVTFIEQVSAIDEDLSARMEAFSELFGTPRPWCDTIRTYRPSGIGSHFDHSDNFVLQQSGVKRWRLASPDNIPKEKYVARLMGQPEVGQQDLPAEGLFDVVLEPGDLLYIPLMWLHSGVSEEGSLSLSVVCPTVTVYGAVVALLARLLRTQNVGHQVLDAVPTWLSDEEKADKAQRVSLVSQTVIERMKHEVTLDELARLQAAACFPGLIDGSSRS